MVKTLALNHHNIDTFEGIDPRTVEERYTNPLTQYWYPTTQAWSWEGGDAIVLLAQNGWGETVGRIVLRLGDKLQVVEGFGGIAGVLKAYGIAEKTTVAN